MKPPTPAATRHHPAQWLPGEAFARLFEVDAAPQLVLTANQTIVAANTAWQAVTHTAKADLLGRRLFEVFPIGSATDESADGSPDLALAIERTITERIPVPVPVREYRVAADEGPGRLRYWSIATLPLLDGDGAVAWIRLRVDDFTDWVNEAFSASAPPSAAVQERILKLERDIALRAQQRLELGMKLRSANEALAQVEQAKDEFLGGLSNELRTPLTLVLGPLDDLLGTQSALTEWQRQALEMARRNAAHLRKAVDLMLAYAQAVAGLPDARYEPVDLAACTAEFASVMRAPIESAGLAFTVDCPPLPESIYVDRGLWETIVLNLLSNALKFTLDGRIELSLRPLGDGVELMVRDTGCGIPAAETGKLFKRLQRFPHGRGRTQEGAGIGLALIRELVHLHGGSIRVDSEWGKGSTFFVTLRAGADHLPAQQVRHCPTRAAPSRAKAYVEEAAGWLAGTPRGMTEAPRAARRPRVLVVEDNADLRAYLGRLLDSLCEVETTGDGRAALADIARQVPDLIIAGTQLPGMDGMELARMIRANPRHAGLPIVMLTANASEDARLACIRAGATDCLAKPFSARELLARVVGLLAQGELLRHEQQMRGTAENDRQRLELVLESIRDGLMVVDRQWRIDLVNACAAGMLGTTREALLGKDFRAGIDIAVVEAVQRVMEQRQPTAFEHFSDAANRWCDYRLSPSPDGGVIVFFVDVTERKQAAERALLVAQHDALTGLPNRKLLREDAERILAAARRQGHRLAVLFLDLDRFKPINDTHGHEVGDKLLKAVAERIGRALRAEDLVGRVGGDEFVAVLVGIEDAADVAHVAANIVATVSRPYFINGLTLEIGTSVGISLFPMDGDTIDILFKRADLAMYSAKRGGRGRFAFFEHGLAPTGPAPAEPPLAERLRAALAAGEFTLDYQPVFAAGTTRVVEVEALLRWPQPDGSRIPPRDFLPVAETTGLIKPLGDWLLRTACAQQQRWVTEGIGEIAVGVTISGAQFRQPDFAARVAAIVRDSGMAPSQLLLNIGERTVTGNIDESIRVLADLQAIGVGIAIKNFGAEQSDVRALSRLPAEKLRLDRSFLSPDSAAHAAADAIIGLGHSLQREVIAEGIEDEADMAYLKARGVQYWQGNLLAAPMAAEEFARWWALRAEGTAPSRPGDLGMQLEA